MSMTAIRIARKRADMIEEIFEDWQNDQRETLLAIDVEDLVKETIGLGESIRRMIDSFGEGITFATTENDILKAHRAGAVLHTVINLFLPIRQLATSVGERVGIIRGLTELDSTKSELMKVRDRFFKAWMLPEETRVSHSKEQIARGEFVEI